MLLNLLKYQSFECYIRFVANSVRAYEITLIEKNKDSLKEMQNITLFALNALLSRENFEIFKNLDSTRNLIKDLEEALID